MKALIEVRRRSFYP